MYLTALLITLVVEIPIVAAFFPGERLRMAAVAAAATTATHLAMHFVLPEFINSLDLWLIVGEIGATMVEASLYAAFTRKNAVGLGFVASAIANTASFLAGVVL